MVFPATLVLVQDAWFLRPLFVRMEPRMTPEMQQSESPYSVKIETATGKSTTLPIVILTPKQLEDLLQIQFQRLTQEAGAKGARIHVERAVAADYEQVVREMTARLLSDKASAA
jgi:hypothetical protein